MLELQAQLGIVASDNGWRDSTRYNRFNYKLLSGINVNFDDFVMQFLHR